MERYKYPRTLHLPFSPGTQSDDRLLEDTTHLEGRFIVMTEKLDGENTSIYSDGHYHARSIDSPYHPSRTWAKRIAGEVHWDLDKYRICGENVYARHSIYYSSLTSYFYIFGIYEQTYCLDWGTTLALAERYNLPTVPVLYMGPYSDEVVQKVWEGRKGLSTYGGTAEGYVVRTHEGFEAADHQHHTGKWVRAKHVQTDEHWMNQAIVPNGII